MLCPCRQSGRMLCIYTAYGTHFPLTRSISPSAFNAAVILSVFMEDVPQYITALCYLRNDSCLLCLRLFCSLLDCSCQDIVLLFQDVALPFLKAIERREPFSGASIHRHSHGVVGRCTCCSLDHNFYSCLSMNATIWV